MMGCTLLQAGAFVLLVAGAFIFPEQPTIGFCMAAGALWLSSGLPVSLGETLELIVFYGALGGAATLFL